MSSVGGLSAGSRERLARVLRAARGAISSADASRALDIRRPEASRLLKSWSANGWLTRVRRGLYVPVPLESSTSDIALEDAWMVADRLFAPCYIGGWSAAEHWGFTEQLFRSTLVFTTRRPRSRRVEARGAVFIVRTVREAAMFGLKPVWRDRNKLNVSDPTRTVLDMLDTPALGGGIRSTLDVLKSYLASKHRDPRLLVQYADRLGNKAVFKRLGYLASAFFPNEAEIIAECRNRLSTGNAKLDPRLPKERLITAWRLWVSESFQRGTPTGATGAKLERGGTATMNRTQVLELLTDRHQQIAARFGVERLALFGSAARDELGVSSDVDVLVEFVGPATFRAYMDLKIYLEELLGRPVDLVTKKALRHELRSNVEKEMINVA
ncbi:MAG: nucleotidyltransferase domain-containing protein [Gammaproteobacteria bacterium]|nr:nucleotidyltransferase domain-containing protein [Gammaproteobacteria bacterium]